MSRISTARIVHLTDSHLVQSGICLGVDSFCTFQKVLQKVASLELPPELLIVTGDLADDGSQATYRRFRSALKDIKVPTYLVPGNHDLVSNMNLVFRNSA